MSGNTYLNLSWLPQAPINFTSDCRAVAKLDSDVGLDLQRLANYSLNGNQLNRLSKVLGSLREGGKSLAPLSSFRLGVLSNSTIDFIIPALEATALRRGIALECVKADYGQVIQEALDPNSIVNRAKPDAVLVAIDLRYLMLREVPGNKHLSLELVAQALEHLRTIRDGIRKNSGAICILQTFVPFPEGLFGSLDRLLPGAPRQMLDALNIGIAESIYGTDDVLLDVAAIAETIGLANWHSPSQWNLAKLPFADELVPLYADHVARILGALRGKSRRCLILDLDNTLWGGVVGDDGLEGIKIAQGDSTGEAHLAVQRMALALRDRGVVLAVSSKNNDEVARRPFREHPEMLLKEEHFAVFQANWQDKATNIQAIAEELSLGLDAMVFLDDNPVERGLVRGILPQVAVPELPEDPALFARTLSAAGYFESVAFSSEDSKRAEYYQDNARRITLQKKAGDVDAYLSSLNMEIIFQPFDKTGRSRIAQLINKSNQYNLTTRRYTESEVADAEHDPNCFTLQVRLLDTFGDNGMISVVICRLSGTRCWEIDTWLMSCRVLGRRVQETVLQELLKHAGTCGIENLIGVYKPTDRNGMVKDHYPLLGFKSTSSESDGTTLWLLNVSTAEVNGVPMSVKSIGFEKLDPVSSSDGTYLPLDQ